MDYNKLKKNIQKRLNQRAKDNAHHSINESHAVDESQNATPGKVALCITVPKTIPWSDYEKELDDVRDGMMEMNYRVPSYPKQISVGDRCYVVHNGMIRGWMSITGIEEREESFQCQTTGRTWTSGIYIKRSGPFHYLKHPIPMKGFMGYKYIQEID